MKRDSLVKKWWIKKARSFKEAEGFDNEYYRHRTPEERLEDMQFCREMYFKLKGININESRKGLRRHFSVIQQKQS
jgi:hypothetical protein